MDKARYKAIEFPLLFEEPLLPGWVYPCTLGDIRTRLMQLPAEDIDGLYAVGLAASTEKHCDVDGRYLFKPRPIIKLFSQRADLRFKLLANTRFPAIQRSLAINIRFGIRFEAVCSRFVCVWEPEPLRAFVLDFVLLHEIGHHVFFRNRERSGLPYTPRVAGSEQFADDYALRTYTLLASQHKWHLR